MPKINIYVPEELAEAIKEAGIPVSAVCQRALETAVKRVTAIREAVQSPSGDLHERSGRMARFTERASTAMKLAVQEARTESAPEVGTEHLLAGLLSEGTNLALQVLRAIDIEPDQVRRELDGYKAASDAASDDNPPDAREAADDAPSDTDSNSPSDADADTVSVALGDSTVTMSAPGSGARIGNQVAAALELAVTEAVSFGHNYVGCEHLLLGLIAEPDGVAGRILRGLGADIRLTRRAVSAAIAGYVHLRANQQQAADTATPTLADPMAKLSSLIDQQLKPVVQRIESLESRLPK